MERWHMRLTIVNEEGGQTAVAMYPDSLYAILETLDECQIPYGNGRYEGKTSLDESNGLIERQADALATALLMPLPQIKKGFYRLRAGKANEQLIAEMAQIFQVSKQAMRIRLESHNLL